MNDLILRLLKIVLVILDNLQVLRLLTYINRKRYIVLLYHGVADDSTLSDTSEPANPINTIVKSSNFTRQMQFLSKNYNVISMDALFTCIKNKKNSVNNSVVITFDDGYYNNYETAFPILQSLQIPATIFLVSDYIGSYKMFWWDEVINAVKKIHDPYFSVSFQDRELQYRSKTKSDKSKAIRSIIRYKNSLNDDDGYEFITAFLAGLKREATENAEMNNNFKILNWENVAEMSRYGISYGSHTKNHALLPNCSYEKAKQEIKESKERLENKLSAECRYFAYPHGGFNPEIKQLVKNSGYHCALSTIVGLNDNNTDMYELRRIAVSANDDLIIFKGKLSGLVGMIRKFTNFILSRFRSAISMHL